MRNRINGAVSIAGQTDTGRVRSHNEDYIEWNAEQGLVVLADGMGGARAGEVASALAVKTMISEVNSALSRERQPLGQVDPGTSLTRAGRLLGAALNHANHTVFQVSKGQPQYAGMGTTLVSVMFYDDAMSVAYVGDSRLYRFRAGELMQMTEDHTVVQELVKGGFYTPEQAQTAVNKNIVTRAVGVEDDIKVDVFEAPVRPTDVYLFCSDGLSDMVDDAEIADILSRRQADLAQAADALIAAANGHGGHDNVSVILARVEESFAAERGWRHRLTDWFF